MRTAQEIRADLQALKREVGIEPPVVGVADMLEWASETPRQPRMACVYVITSSRGHIKIGISKNPEQRLKQLQTGNQHSLSLAYKTDLMPRAQASQIEREMHKGFVCLKSRSDGEWFRCTQVAALALITSIKSKVLTAA